MSNKTQLQSLNAKYESLIEELRGKAVGGGSGGSVETCTVTFDGFTNAPGGGCCVMTGIGETQVVMSDTTVECVCGSIVALYNPMGMSNPTVTNCRMVYSNVLLLPTEAGSVATIVFG